MKLAADRFDAPAITGYGSDWVAVNGERMQGALILSSSTGAASWSLQSLAELRATHFEALLASQSQGLPELIVLGTGARQAFPAPESLAPLIAAGIGLEAMDSLAACRTYNILASEGRRVVLALLPLQAQA